MLLIKIQSIKIDHIYIIVINPRTKREIFDTFYQYRTCMAIYTKIYFSAQKKFTVLIVLML